MHAFDGRADRRTDGQTDRILIARPRLHSMQRDKNPCDDNDGDDYSENTVTQSLLRWAIACDVVNIPINC